MVTNKQILEARRLFQSALEGNLRSRAEVVENFTTSDFPYLLGAGYARELVSEYRQHSTKWGAFSRRVTVSDFRAKKVIELLGGKVGLSKVGQAAEYPARTLHESEREIQVAKYGDRIPLTWEMIVNDDLGAFDNLASELARAAGETEDLNTAKVLLNAGGTNYNTSFFLDSAQNIDLGMDSLENAIQTILTRTDENKRPVMVNKFSLVVPPALAMKANSIVNSIEIRRTDPISGDVTVERNGTGDLVQVSVNPWIAAAASSKANSRWFVLPDPNGQHPAVATAFLRGNESPDLRVKADAGNRIGGGAIAPTEGSFDDDTIQYRVRHVTGSALLDPIGAYASNGA